MTLDPDEILGILEALAAQQTDDPGLADWLARKRGEVRVLVTSTLRDSGVLAEDRPTREKPVSKADRVAIRPAAFEQTAELDIEHEKAQIRQWVAELAMKPPPGPGQLKDDDGFNQADYSWGVNFNAAANATDDLPFAYYLEAARRLIKYGDTQLDGSKRRGAVVAAMERWADAHAAPVLRPGSKLYKPEGQQVKGGHYAWNDGARNDNGYKTGGPDKFRITGQFDLKPFMESLGLQRGRDWQFQKVNGWWLEIGLEHLHTVADALDKMGRTELAEALRVNSLVWEAKAGEGMKAQQEEAARAQEARQTEQRRADALSTDAATLSRARSLMVKMQRMANYDLRKDEGYFNAGVEVVARLLAAGFEPGGHQDMGEVRLSGRDYGRWQMYGTDGGNERFAVQIPLSMNMKYWDKGDANTARVPGGSPMTLGGKGFHVSFDPKQILRITRALERKNLPLALAIRLSYAVDTMTRECPELDAMATAGSLAEIADPFLRERVAEIIRRIPLPTDPTLRLREYQEVGVAYAALSGFRCLIGDSPGVGKAQPLDAKVLTPAGWSRMGDLAVGDAVVDPDGGVGFVTGVYPQGVRPIFKLTTKDGAATECCDEHLWFVQTRDDRRTHRAGRILALKDFRSDLKMPNGGGWEASRYFLPLCKPVTYVATEALPLSPYLLGVLLGDGSFCDGSPELSNPDDMIIAWTEAMLPEGVSLKRDKSGVCDYRITTAGVRGHDGRPLPNPLTEALRNFGLWGKGSHEKFVPKQYLAASPTDRHALLCGLMDTDGDCSKRGVAIYNTSSPQLRDDVVELVCSLGGFASVTSRIPEYEYNGEKRKGRLAFRVNIRLPINPFLLVRKGERWQRPILARAIDKVEAIEAKEAQCIAVSTKRKLYITDDFLVTHNTATALGALSLAHQQLLPALVVGPASVTWNWAKEIKRFAPWFTPHVIESPNDDLPPPNGRTIYICSWAILAKISLNPMLMRSLRCIVLDEAHSAKNASAQRTEAAMALAEACPHVLLLTGTPMLNRTVELYTQLHMIDAEEFPTKKDFAERYADLKYKVIRLPGGGARQLLDDSGASNLEELSERLRCYMIRRTKTQVQRELPEKTRNYVWMDLPPAAAKAYRKVEDEMGQWVCVNFKARALKTAARKFVALTAAMKRGDVEKIPAKELAERIVEESNSEPPNKDSAELAIVQLGNLRRVTGEAKAAVAVQWINDYFAERPERDDPLVVFVEHQPVLATIGDALNKLGLRWTYIDGSVTGKARFDRVEAFQEGQFDVIVCSQAAYAGITLTRASNMLFVERWWVPAFEEQAEDRIHRFGQQNAVIINYIMAHGTTDEHIAELVDTKRSLIESVIGGERVMTDEERADIRGEVSGSLASALAHRITAKLASSGRNECFITTAELKREVEALIAKGGG